MKKLMILTMLFFGVVSQKNAQAQVSIHVNIGSQPDWGPEGYDYVDYYYLPDIDVYYNVPQRRFVYPEGGRWVFASSLPPRYRGYDFYNGYKVVLNEPRPYLHADVYRVRYAKYKKGAAPRQIVIRDSHDNRYKNNGPGNSDHRDNGNGKNKGKGKGHGKGHDND